jgi:hypothetical protein
VRLYGQNEELDDVMNTLRDILDENGLSGPAGEVTRRVK